MTDRISLDPDTDNDEIVSRLLRAARLNGDGIEPDDLSDAAGAIEELTARAEKAEADAVRLREALKRCPPDRPMMTGTEFRDAVYTWWRLWARPALAGGEMKE